MSWTPLYQFERPFPPYLGPDQDGHEQRPDLRPAERELERLRRHETALTGRTEGEDPLTRSAHRRHHRYPGARRRARAVQIRPSSQ
jgi:hypothetical protein